MADLKPLGSEKLEGQDKIRRIMEIARFNEALPELVNETAKSQYSVSLADGNNYEIVKDIGWSKDDAPGQRYRVSQGVAEGADDVGAIRSQKKLLKKDKDILLRKIYLNLKQIILSL